MRITFEMGCEGMRYYLFKSEFYRIIISYDIEIRRKAVVNNGRSKLLDGTFVRSVDKFIERRLPLFPLTIYRIISFLYIYVMIMEYCKRYQEQI